MTKPVAIDLFCGLFQAKFGWRADALIKQFVACRAKNPKHLALAVGHKAPSPVAFISWAMRYLKDATFWACFTRCRKIGIFSAQSLKRPVFVGSARVVDLLNTRLSLMETAPLLLCGFPRTLFRAVAFIAVGRWNLEMRTAHPAVTASFRDVGLLSSAPSSRATLTGRRAIEFIRALGFESTCAFDARKIVHNRGLA